MQKLILAVCAFVATFVVMSCTSAAHTGDPAGNALFNKDNCGAPQKCGASQDVKAKGLAEEVLIEAKNYFDERKRGEKDTNPSFQRVQRSLEKLAKELGVEHNLSKLINDHKLLPIWDQRWIGPTEGEHKDKPEYNLKSEVEKIAKDGK